MFTFSVSDSFYRFNCQSGISFDSGIHGVTKMLILPYGNKQLTNICECAYKTLDKDLKKVVIYSPTNDDISEHLDLLNDREVIVKTCSEDINPNIIENDKEINTAKKYYAKEKILIPMIKAHYIIVCDYLKSPKEFRFFDKMLKKHLYLYNDLSLTTKYIKFQRNTKGMLLKFNEIIKKLYRIVKRR